MASIDRQLRSYQKSTPGTVYDDFVEIDKENQLWMQGEVRAITSVGAINVAYYESVVP